MLPQLHIFTILNQGASLFMKVMPNTPRNGQWSSSNLWDLPRMTWIRYIEELGAVEWSLYPPTKKKMSRIGPDPSPIYHFFSKLLWVKDGMATDTGKELAEKRHQKLIAFLQDYKEEMEFANQAVVTETL